MNRSGHADLPLHHGRVPTWLAERMSRLGRAISEVIVMEYGRDALLQRLSDPLWFQSLGCVLGMDWHSSGITTSVMGALKRGLSPISHELGLYICGGRGKHSRKTPEELLRLADRTGLDGDHLVRCSKLSAKVDNTAVQDGFQLYLHNFIVTQEGSWAVVQQGMNGDNGFARRYHWHSPDLKSFISDPHSAVCGQNLGPILNAVHQEAAPTRQGIMEISQSRPEHIMKEARQIQLPAHHEVRRGNVNLKRLAAVLTLAQEQAPQDFESLLLLQGLGPRTLQSLVLVSEVIHGTPSRFEDPARFSFAHGGKDGHPFPVPTRVYDQTIDTLDQMVQKAKLDHSEKSAALKRLHESAKRLENDIIPRTTVAQQIEKEWREAPIYGGRTVKEDFSLPKDKPGDQLSLF